VDKSRKTCEECIGWLRMHPVEQIRKYIERYDMQTQWIKENMGKTNNEINIEYNKNDRPNNSNKL
jgi:hypothetical protein